MCDRQAKAGNDEAPEGARPTGAQRRRKGTGLLHEQLAQDQKVGSREEAQHPKDRNVPPIYSGEGRFEVSREIAGHVSEASTE